MGQPSGVGSGYETSFDHAATSELKLGANDTEIQSVGWSFHELDMNNASLTTDLILKRVDFDITPGPLSNDYIWTWNILHIAVVSVAVILFIIVILSILLCAIYHKRLFRRTRANVSFGVTRTPPYGQARSKIYSRFAAQERARRLAESQETLRKSTPSPVAINEEIPLTVLKQMQSAPNEECNDVFRDSIHQETQIDGALHQSMPFLHVDGENNILPPQIERVPSHSLPRHMHMRTYSNQKYRHIPRHVRPDLNGNVTHPVPRLGTRCYTGSGWRSRAYQVHATDPRLERARRRLLSEPIVNRRMCTCHYHQTMSRGEREERMMQSYRRPRLPKFNLAGENIPTSSEPSVIDGGIRAPDNSFAADDHCDRPVHRTYTERRKPNYNNNQDVYPVRYGHSCPRTTYRETRVPTPRLVVPTNTPNSNCSGSVIMERGNTGHAIPVDSDFGASAGVSQCNVSSDTSMAVAIGTACSSDVGDYSYEWDGYDPAYGSQVLEFIDGAYFPVLHSSQYWV